ncbi:3253_t:CDS:10 [Funneliformis geosporum]|uniref:18466_t:CDS:1 n=1 Tax=Funneliformis geosporum TaxID=1117311 RepID=A0A9W4WZD1_9GLOM|nr:3253_t:CDS:10 [Funneliformis geosporum]CAI2183736.1 18466_t:CDS:10 [Funneliformis geosporum]
MKHGSDEMKTSASQMNGNRKGHRRYFKDVDIFWQKVERRYAELKASTSIMHDTTKVFKNSIINVNSSMENVNNTMQKYSEELERVQNALGKRQNSEDYKENRISKRHQNILTVPPYEDESIFIGSTKGDLLGPQSSAIDDATDEYSISMPPTKKVATQPALQDKSNMIDNAMIDDNNGLDKWAKETLQRNGEWLVGNKKVNVHDLLVLWQNEKKRPHNDLACYDIIDITPGTNSDFVKNRPKDELEEMKKYGSPVPDIDNSDIKELIMKMVKESDYQKAVEDSYLLTRNDDRKKFMWDFAYHLANSFDRGNDLLNENLSERMYREVFLTPLMRSLFQKTHKDMDVSFGEISLFASAEDYDLTKSDEEERSSGRKIDIIWTTMPKLEFAIGEVSGPPNQRQHPHFFGDKLKIAKMLKVMLNRIVRMYGGIGDSLSLLKLYGLQIYNHTAFVYEMTVPYKGLYLYREVLRFQLPTNHINVVLLCRCVPMFLLFKEMLNQSLNNLNTYIKEAGLRTPTENNAQGSNGKDIKNTELQSKYSG